MKNLPPCRTPAFPIDYMVGREIRTGGFEVKAPIAAQ
jgi:hypothetical protein